MSGPELAKKLREWGVTEKSQMAGLEEFEYLQIQAILEARGLWKVGTTAAQDASQASGLIVKKKKKNPLKPSDDDAPAEVSVETVEPPSAPIPAAAPAPAPTRRPEPTPEPVHATAPAILAPTPVARPIEAPVEPVEAPRAPVLVAEVPAPVEVEEPVEPEVVEGTLPETRIVEMQPSRPPAPGEAPAVAAAAATTDVNDPNKPQRKGKVTGFIDLSKIKSQPQKKTESRRLRSKDDVAPDVKPTLGHDKKSALVRGDRGQRGTLTAGELREREAGRFLRRTGPGMRPGPGQGGGGGGGSGPRGPRGPRLGDAGDSPHAGGEVKIDSPVTVKKLADRLSVKSNDLLKVAIRQLGFGVVNINSMLDDDTAILLANEFGVELVIVQEVEAEQEMISELKKKRTDVGSEKLAVRPPTVAFLGHVDHGKTTLIDSIRHSRVAEGEAGGITQHIGAYQVTTKKGHTLTILDTPGHAAFTAMRARGAKAVDIVVLVVSADDGVMPSTEEALAHARAAKVPVVVALTKIDKPEANPQRAMEGLSRLGLIPEEWGGETAMIKVSALKGIGVEELLERVFLESEVLELRCHPEGPAQGVVLEAEISEGKGIVAHLLVQDGTLKRGDVILAGEGYGKVRSMHDDRNKVVGEAPPSMPIEVSGLSALPGVGETFYVVGDLSQAKEVAEERERKNRALSLTERRTVTAESLMRAVADQKRLAINLIVRADVQGSVEVLKNSLGELKHEEVEVKVLFAGVGTVTENDVNLASTSNAMIIAFHVGVNDKARIAAERLSVDIRYYEVIYELLDHMRGLMEGTLAPEMAEEITGHVEVRALFRSSKIGLIAGCHVTDGSVFRDSKVRLMRDGAVIHTGQMGSLRREKDDAKEVRAGFDCGITLKDYQDLRERDVIEAYKIIKVKRTLGD